MAESVRAIAGASLKGDAEVAPWGDGRLLVSAKEAARLLSISVRLLWTLTNTGQVPSVRLGRRVLYPVAELAEWVRMQTESLSS